MVELTQNILTALSLGALYALLALGLAMVFSVMGLVNFAHGELITIAGFTMYGLQGLGWPPEAMMGAAILASIAAAVGMERLAFRPVRNARGTTLLLTSFGLSIVIQNTLLALTEPRPNAVRTIAWLNSQFRIGSITVQNLQVVTTGITIVALAVLVIILKRTRLGIAMRAASENFQVVRLMGVSADKVIRGTFAISGALAGLAAVLIIARRGAIDPYMGLIFVLKAFVASVLGGFGSLPGAVVGGFALGILEVLFEIVLPDALAGFRDAFVFLLVGLILVARPQGIFGRPQRGFA